MRALAAQRQQNNAHASGRRPAGRGGPARVPNRPANLHDEEAARRHEDACTCGGGCPRCQSASARASVQAKLRVGAPGDEFEREADRAAEELTTANGAFDPQYAHADGATVRLKAAPGGRGAGGLSGGEMSGGELNVGGLPGGESHASLGAGRPLPAGEREFFESRFGTGFGDVRVHADAGGDASASALDARAYTAGSHIVFAAGEYAPGSTAGRRLLAHELTHVIQQRAGHAPAGVVQRQPPGKGGFTPLDADGQKRCLEAFDKSLKELEDRIGEESLKKVTDDKLKETTSVAEMRKAGEILKKLRDDGQVTCGTFQDPGKHAVYDYDGPGGKIQLRITEGVAGSSANLLHEGIHGVHGEKYPKTSKTYSQAQSGQQQVTGKQEEELKKYKAWTEYWAVKRAAEYSNLDPKRAAQDRLDPAETARKNSDVNKALREVWKFDKTFDPETWKPPN
jgi:hypothetical protein